MMFNSGCPHRYNVCGVCVCHELTLLMWLLWPCDRTSATISLAKTCGLWCARSYLLQEMKTTEDATLISSSLMFSLCSASVHRYDSIMHNFHWNVSEILPFKVDFENIQNQNALKGLVSRCPCEHVHISSSPACVKKRVSRWSVCI